jgi:hypothetical protein
MGTSLRYRSSLGVCALGLCLAIAGPARPQDGPIWLQGLFCNTEAQVDAVLAHVASGGSWQGAAARANRMEIVCTYVDLLRFGIGSGASIGYGGGPLVRYRGELVAVQVGGAVRPVSPPVELFFVTPDAMGAAPFEEPT